MFSSNHLPVRTLPASCLSLSACLPDCQLLAPTYNPEGLSGPVKQGWDQQRNLVLHEVRMYVK